MESPSINPRAGVDRAKFRDAMSRLGAAVSVVTSDGPAGRCGTTVTAVSSVTDTPATLLVCVNRSAWSNQAIKANGVLCVNVLTQHDSAKANLFAGMANVPMADRFNSIELLSLVTGAPVLPGVLAAFDCWVDDVVEVGTHSIFLAKVAEISIGEEGSALLYFRRRYGTVLEIASEHPRKAWASYWS